MSTLNAGELASAREWIKSREGKSASRGMILAVRLLATLDARASLPADGVIVTPDSLARALHTIRGSLFDTGGNPAGCPAIAAAILAALAAEGGPA